MMKRFLVAIAFLASALLAQQKKIVVTGMGVAWIPEMQVAAPNVTFVAAKPDEVVAQAADADAILGVISPELFGAAKKLKSVHIYSAGVETYRFPAFINSNVMHQRQDDLGSGDRRSCVCAAPSPDREHVPGHSQHEKGGVSQAGLPAYRAAG